MCEMDVWERGEWEELEKNRKDRKIGNSDFIDSVGVTNSYVRKVQINWFLHYQIKLCIDCILWFKYQLSICFQVFA